MDRFIYRLPSHPLVEFPVPRLKGWPENITHSCYITIRGVYERGILHTQALILGSISREEIGGAGAIYGAPVDGATIRSYEEKRNIYGMTDS
jgi:hypothetical protein